MKSGFVPFEPGIGAAQPVAPPVLDELPPDAVPPPDVPPLPVAPPLAPLLPPLLHPQRALPPPDASDHAAGSAARRRSATSAGDGRRSPLGGITFPEPPESVAPVAPPDAEVDPPFIAPPFELITAAPANPPAPSFELPEELQAQTPIATVAHEASSVSITRFRWRRRSLARHMSAVQLRASSTAVHVFSGKRGARGRRRTTPRADVILGKCGLRGGDVRN